ncbi:MAG: hypothetical protein DRI71_10880 [Bacteroidetes bacterium]|nr:MAG: hypothetical protein DRI71_10880 [Bacteroidota bacterium]
MESKLNFEAIETYAKAYTTKFLDEVYASKEKIAGDEILQLPVEQVGLLILNNIYQSWALEAEKLKSAYFNYEAEGVKAEMKRLMNVLSKNILVDKPSFEPLLIDAVKKTLLLIASPYNFYNDLLNEKEVSLDSLVTTKKFLKINNGVLKMLINKLEISPEMLNNPRVLLDEAFGSIDSVPLNNDDIVQKFSIHLTLVLDDFYIEEEAKPVLHAQEFEGEDDEDDESESTINDSFIGNSYETVADKLKNNRQTDSLKSMLSINEKFMFINDLFDGNQEDFTKVLDFLESCESRQEAVSFVENNYLKHNIWKENAPQVKAFMALLDKKFVS